MLANRFDDHGFAREAVFQPRDVVDVGFARLGEENRLAFDV